MKIESPKSNVSLILKTDLYGQNNLPKFPGTYQAYRIYSWDRKKGKLEPITISATTQLIAVTEQQFKYWKSLFLIAYPITIRI
jgi:hypothetical protein